MHLKTILISAYIPGSMHSLRDYHDRRLRQALEGRVKLIFHNHYQISKPSHYMMRISELARSYDIMIADYSTRVYTRARDGIYIAHGYGTKLCPGLNELESEASMASMRMMRQNVQHMVTLGYSEKDYYWRFEGDSGLPYPHIYPLGLPRNDVLYNNEYVSGCRAEIDREYGTAGKFIILFAPTWRGYEVQPPHTHADFDRLDKRMGELGACMFYRPHYIENLYQHVDFSQFNNIYDGAFSKQSSTTTLQSAADMVLTDYSTIFIDYLPLQRPVAFDLFDWERYDAYRGMVYKKDDQISMPGPQIASLDGLADYVADIKAGKDAFANLRRQSYEHYFAYRDGGSSARVWALMLDILGIDRPEILDGVPGIKFGGEQL